MGTTIESDWENTRLLDELAAARAEIERLQAESDPEALHIAYLHGQADRNKKLAAEQAKNVGLREALEYSIKQVPELATVPGISKALSTPSDTSALEAIVKKAGEVMRKKCAKEGWTAANGDCEDRVASAIRALPAVTLKDL